MKLNEININILLQNVAIIQKKYDDVANLTGEKFNIFSIMNMENSERYTHSAIIGELLNPKGSHSQGTIFLKLFLEEIFDEETIQKFNLDNTKVIIEEFIGNINESFTQGGYIDIVIKDDKNIVVIENKINASDQKGQLLRYKNYYPKGHLVYLTKEGKEPSEDSIKVNNECLDKREILLVSYSENIKRWLKKCHKEAVEIPMLREIIKQYLCLVEKITNQNSNNKMNDEVLEVLINNHESYRLIVESEDLLDKKIIEKLRSDLKDFDLALKLDDSQFDLSNKEYSGFEFTNDFLNDNNLKVRFEFDSNNYGCLQHGFVLLNNGSQISYEKLISNYKNLFQNTKSSSTWIVYSNFESHYSWSNDKSKNFGAILNGEMQNSIKEVLIKFIKMIEESL